MKCAVGNKGGVARSGVRAAKGQAVLEITASIIIFVMLVAIMISISLYLYVQHAVVSVAREGARFAALNTELGDIDTQDDGIRAVQDRVIAAGQQLAGVTLDEDDIAVTPPDLAAMQGDRTVRVDIRFTLQNPLAVDRLMAAFGASGDAFSQIPVSARAVMRYEE